MFHTPKKITALTHQPTSPTKVNRTATVTKPQTNVRRSIGEWEAGRVLFPEECSVAPQCADASSREVPAPQSLPEAVKIIPTTARADRVKEARAWVTKAKTALNASRNLKTDIKADVTQAIDRLYQLVKGEEVHKSAPFSLPASTRVEREDEYDPQLWKEKEQREDEQRIESGRAQVSQLLSSLAEHSKLMRDSNNTAGELKKALEKNTKVLEETSHTSVTEIPSKNTYARVAAGMATALPKPMHSIIVKSTEPIDTSSNLVDMIRAAVDAKENGIRIDKVRKAGDQKVIVGCHSKVELQAVKDRLGGTAERFVVEDAVNRDPLVVLLDVMKYNTDDDIIKAVTKQNAHLLRDIGAEDVRVSVKYRKRSRNLLENHVVVQVSPPVWQRLITAGRAHVDLQRVRVVDQSPLIQCTRCLGFGHGRKLCTEKGDLCSYCCDPGHLRTDCPHRQAGKAAKCKNCSDEKKDETDHDSFDLDCPMRRRWDAIARSTVAYC